MEFVAFWQEKMKSLFCWSNLCLLSHGAAEFYRWTKIILRSQPGLTAALLQGWQVSLCDGLVFGGLLLIGGSDQGLCCHKAL